MVKAGVVAIAVGLCCLLAFQLQGSVVDSQAFLKEPFALLPIGLVLIFGGAVAIVGALLRWRWTLILRSSRFMSLRAFRSYQNNNLNLGSNKDQCIRDAPETGIQSLMGYPNQG